MNPLAILVIGSGICLAAAVDFWLGTNYLAGIRGTERRVKEECSTSP